ncbi:MAG: nuclear transport factor 2 family protein [Cyclobacteriaceae bacterium]
MRNLYISILVIALFMSCNYSKNIITESDINKLMSRWEEAYKTKDVRVMEEILDDSWVYSGNKDGTTSNKSTTMDELQNADYRFLSMTFDDLNIDYYDDVAIIRAKERLTLQLANGDTVEFQLRFTDVYQKQNGITRAISTHSSPLTN